MRSKQEIYAILKKNSSNISNFGIDKLGVFGSYARNEQNAESDIDLLVDFKENQKNYSNFINLSNFLEDLLKLRIELVTLDSLSSPIKNKILNSVEYVLFN